MSVACHRCGDPLPDSVSCDGCGQILTVITKGELQILWDKWKAEMDNDYDFDDYHFEASGSFKDYLDKQLTK